MFPPAYPESTLLMLTRPAVNLAYRLEGSYRYQQFKSFFRDLLENPRSRLRPYFDLFMMLLVTSSVFLFIYEVKHGSSFLSERFEQFAVAVLIAEYLLRLWLCTDSRKIVIEHYEKAEFLGLPFRLWPALREILRSKSRYLTTPFAVIDLLAILPAYTQHHILRVFILFRLVKLFRYVHSANELVRVLSEKRFELFTLAFFIGFVIFFSSTAMYVFEYDRGQIRTFYDALYWSFVTLFTVGYGDITPQTAEGRVVTFLLVLSGVGLVAYLTSVLLAAFHEKMDELRETRVLADIQKHRDLVVVCGYGRMGTVVARKLHEDQTSFVVIDRERERVERARKLDYPAILGDASSDEVLRSVGILDRVSTVLPLTGDDVLNVYITLTARHLNPSANIISRANKPDSVRKLEQAGANHIIQPFEIAGLTVAEYVGQPVAFEAIYGIASGEKHLRMEAVMVREGSILEGRRIADARIGDFRLILFGVIGTQDNGRSAHQGYALRARHFYFNPPRDFVLHASDILVVFGHEYSLNHFKEQADKGLGKLLKLSL
jgi:voltage-gated potassium channel